MSAAHALKPTAPAAKKGRKIGPAASFKVISAAAVNVLFDNGRKKSPYLLALQQLIRAGDGQILEFDAPGARHSVYQQASKHGIKVLFAEQDGKLYVKIDGPVGPEATILKFLEDSPKTLNDISVELANRGYTEQDPRKLMTLLSENGRVALRSCATAAGDVKKWALLATKS